MAKHTFNYENVDVTIDFLHADLIENHEGMKDHIAALTYQIMILNHITSTEEEQNYFFVGRDKTPVPPADPNSFTALHKINYETFVPVIKEYILQNPTYVNMIRKYGHTLGLCDAPELPNQNTNNAVPIKSSRTKPQYNSDGLGVIRI